MHERDAAIRLLCLAAQPAPDASEVREAASAVSDWDGLIDLAVGHSVLGLAARTFVGIDGVLPGRAAVSFDQHRRSLQRRGVAAAAETVRLVRLLGEAGVEALPLKGPVLALQAYGDTGVRDYGDIDLLVRRHDLERGREALARDGYRRPPDSTPRAERWFQRTINQAMDMTRSGSPVPVELHGTIHPPFFGVPLDRHLWDRRVSLELAGMPIAAMSAEDALLVACTHASRTGWQRLEHVGCVAHLTKRELDWPLVIDAARRARASRMLAVGLRLAQEVLRCDPPAGAAPLARDATAGQLARALSAELLHGDPYRWTADGYMPARNLLHFRIRDRARDRVAYVARLVLVPTLREAELVQLPRRLEPLYPLLRLARVAWLALTTSRRLRRPA